MLIRIFVNMGTALIVSVAGLILTLFLVVSLALRIRKLRKKVAGIPGPQGLPLLGNSLTFAGISDTNGLWLAFKSLTEECEGIMKFWLGPVLMIAVNDPAYANVALTHSATVNKHPWYTTATFVKNGVFSTNGKHYERLRKSLYPLLLPKVLTNWHDFVASKAVQAIECLDERAGMGEFDVSEVIFSFHLDLTSKIILGEDLNEMKNKEYNFHHSLKECIDTFFRRIFKPQYFNDYVFSKTNLGKKYANHVFEMNALLRHFLAKRSQALEAQGINLKSDFEEENYSDVIIKVGQEQNLSLEEMAKMLCDIPVGGADTPAVIAASMLLYLAMHPQYQQEAYEEQIDVLGDTLKAPTVEQLARMPFLSWVEKETQRLVGTPLIARYTTDDLEIGGHTIPKDVGILVLINQMHRNPKFFDNPDEFNPRHFSPENEAKRPKHAFLPFGNGYRRCPGRLFSYLTNMTLISVLLRAFKFTTSKKYSDIQYKYSLLLEIVGGYPVQITRRT